MATSDSAKLNLRHPYADGIAVLATMHGKEQAIAPAFARALGMRIVVPASIDTDALGTFTGEIPRHGTMLEVAIRKARLGMKIEGRPIGIASEGTFARNPQMPVMPAGIELMVLVDDERGFVISESLISLSTNFSHVAVSEVFQAEDYLAAAGFPEHAVVVKANGEPGACTGKGIVDRESLRCAVQAAAALSSDGLARLESDMRAHYNPTRMATIGELANRLARRLARLCPNCGAPGYDVVEVRRGLPCGTCGTPTELVSAEIQRCNPCNFEEVAAPGHGLTFASTLHCPECNP